MPSPFCLVQASSHQAAGTVHNPGRKPCRDVPAPAAAGTAEVPTAADGGGALGASGLLLVAAARQGRLSHALAALAGTPGHTRSAHLMDSGLSQSSKRLWEYTERPRYPLKRASLEAIQLVAPLSAQYSECVHVLWL